MWPTIFELSTGETQQVPTEDGPRVVTLIAYRESWAPDYWIRDNPEHRTLERAEVTVDVSGVRATLTLRPYQLPVIVNGVQLYVEATHNWAIACKDRHRLLDMHKEVRFSALDAALPWGPPDFEFPIRGYRWRSSPYNNTWGSLVPYNHLYYHRGDDFGAMPDRLEVVAALPGTVAERPAKQAAGSNPVHILSPDGVAAHYAHMNIEMIDPDLTVGTEVSAGQRLGATGCTWNGARTQTHDPHLHFSLSRGELRFSPYPFLVQAYLRSYLDPVLPVAGGYAYTVPGRPVKLDGSLSVARPGERIASYAWRLHDDTLVEGATTQVSIDRPGLYCEELIVRTQAGYEDRDLLQVRVYDPAQGNRLAYGWAYHTPVRGIRPGQAVLFWNRLRGTVGPVQIDYGDGSPAEEIGDESKHAYAHPGSYAVRLSGRGPNGEPVTIGMRVAVE